MAFTILNAIEAGTTPAIEQGLISYDLATNRPFAGRKVKLARLKAHIQLSVTKGLLGMGDPTSAFSDPWRPALESHSPGLRAKLLDIVDQHVTGLATTGVAQSFKPWWERDIWARAAIFVAGALVGAVVQAVTRKLFAL